MMRAGTPTLFILAFVASVAAATTDLIIRERITSGPGAARDEMVYISGTKRVTDNPQTRTIVDAGAKTLTIVDKQKQTYSVRTFDGILQQAEAMKKHLGGLPPEVKKMMPTDAPVTVRPTGKTEKIAGYEAREYELEGGAMKATIWAAESLDVAGAEEWKKLAGSIGGAHQPGAQMAEAMSKIKGLPLRTSMTMAMGPSKTTFVTEALEVQEKSPPPDVLTVPQGFKKVEPPAFGH